ncbi:MAG: hypothetical protein JW966_00810, partial [Anaerolineae bacterium]|nr:hypothetical protein [Anaerolineae bacterium]
TNTATNTPTDTPTNTPTVTDTPTNTATFTPTATDTPTSTPTFTPTATDTPTNTPTDTPTATDTPTNTATFTPTATDTPTSTPTFTPTATETPTNTPTFTPTATFTITFTPTLTATTIPSPTPVPAGRMPYVQDMEGDGALESWEYDPLKWQLVTEGGNVVLVGQSGLESSLEILGREVPEWQEPSEEDLLIQMRINAMAADSIGRILFRHSDQGYYALEFQPGYMALRRGTSGAIVRNTEQMLRDLQVPTQAGRWYQLSIWAEGSRIFVYIDSQLWLSVNDSGFALPTSGAILLQTRSATSGQVGFDDLIIQRPELASEHFQGSTLPTTWAASSFTNVGLDVEGDGNQYVRLSGDAEIVPAVLPLDNALIACRLYSEQGGFTARIRESGQGAYVLKMEAGNMQIQQLNGQGDVLQTWTRQNYYGRGKWFDFIIQTSSNRLLMYRLGELIFEEEIENAPPAGGLRFSTSGSDSLRIDDCLFTQAAFSSTIDAQFAFDILSTLETRIIRDGRWDWYEFFENQGNAYWWEGGAAADPGEYVNDEAAAERRRYYVVQTGGEAVARRFRPEVDETRTVFGWGEDLTTYRDSTDIYIKMYMRLPIDAPDGSTGWLGARSEPSVTGLGLNQYQLELVKGPGDTVTARVRANTSLDQAIKFEQVLDTTPDDWHELIIVTLDDRIAFFADGRLLTVLRGVELLGGTLAIGVEPNSIVDFDDLVVRDTSVNE